MKEDLSNLKKQMINFNQDMQLTALEIKSQLAKMLIYEIREFEITSLYHTALDPSNEFLLALGIIWKLVGVDNELVKICEMFPSAARQNCERVAVDLSGNSIEVSFSSELGRSFEWSENKKERMSSWSEAIKNSGNKEVSAIQYILIEELAEKGVLTGFETTGSDITFKINMQVDGKTLRSINFDNEFLELLAIRFTHYCTRPDGRPLDVSSDVMPIFNKSAYTKMWEIDKNKLIDLLVLMIPGGRMSERPSPISMGFSLNKR